MAARRRKPLFEVDDPFAIAPEWLIHNWDLPAEALRLWLVMFLAAYRYGSTDEEETAGIFNLKGLAEFTHRSLASVKRDLQALTECDAISVDREQGRESRYHLRLNRGGVIRDTGGHSQ